MLNRILLGTGVSTATVLASSMTVAHAAVAQNDDILPVYDEEVQHDEAPLPGTILPAKSTSGDSKLAEVESKATEKVEEAHSRAESAVRKFSKTLQSYVGSAREVLDSQLQQADVKAQELTHKYRESERSAAESVAALKSEKEDLLPESIYVLIAGLSGSIVARRRNFLLRTVTSWGFAGVAFAYFLPHTWANVRKAAWRFEQEQFPSVAQQHAQSEESLSNLAQQGRETYDGSKKQAKDTIKSVRQQIKEWTGF